MSESVFAVAAVKAPSALTPEGEVLTAEFLETCRFVVTIIEKMGAGLYPAKMDVNGNIERLATASNVAGASKLLFDIVKNDVAAGTDKDPKSNTKGLLWLKRGLQFVLRLLQGLLSDRSCKLYDVVSTAYTDTLRQYHGFLASSAFSVALNVVGQRDGFEAACGGNPETLYEEMGKFVDTFSPVLTKIHDFLDANGLDDPTPV
ncbi:hypothetical protein CYMTET_54489 [Cymbomonas tetramitiformis]|uniref:Glycolipid transfer protein domain-containing protein n=1 Tax=Cymbomonas tetramitiformis TaxID=36881 RepID=A0AAE0EPA4_9CHLO|nr:hypothetical protein CYMTET_54489 [Cymbomonas tetramitiformis]